MYHIIDGKKIADDIIETVRTEIAAQKLHPQLAVILVGNDPASHLYVKLKERACKHAGIIFHKYLITEAEDEQKVLETIRFLNNDPEIDAILIQLPLPKKFNQSRIIETLDYRKDVDGFHGKNIESLLSGKKQHILPGLALGITKLIESTGEPMEKKTALIISKSDEFAFPLKTILQSRGLHVDTAKPDAQNIRESGLAADILITAVGRPKFITSDMVKKDAIVIDVGISKVNGKIVGDVDFEAVAPRCSHITPVPGGVGPMTVAMLLYNTSVLAHKKHARK